MELTDDPSIAPIGDDADLDPDARGATVDSIGTTAALASGDLGIVDPPPPTSP